MNALWLILGIAFLAVWIMGNAVGKVRDANEREARERRADELVQRQLERDD